MSDNKGYKYTKCNFGWDSATYSAESLQRSLDSLAGFMGAFHAELGKNVNIIVAFTAVVLGCRVTRNS